MLGRTADKAAATGPARGRGLGFAALVAAGLSLSPVAARAMECGMPLPTQSCAERGQAAGCGLLYLQISNLVEDGPVLNGLSVQPQTAALVRGAAAAPAGGDALCRSAAAAPLPPADPGSPDRDCVAYLLPACTYGVQALFGDGSRAAARDVRVAAQPEGGRAEACARVTVDLGGRSVSSGTESCDGAVVAQAGPAESPMAQGPEGPILAGTVTAVTAAETARAEP